ncbi:MAG TPA: single-stranded DNA-binding protein [Solirubrobacteraceae bacterium]|jgi:single-strand DNA-binding protein|nr:single-stranded DNA-binding protein [Solirubrobacteraceae bacterium]
MSAVHINRVTLTGNLTRDPEVRALPSGATVCALRVACNTRRKDSSTGEWQERPHYFDVSVWGGQGESCGRFLRRGRPVAVDGRLEWREWEAPDGSRRQAVEIVAETVQFLGAPGPASPETGDEQAPGEGEPVGAGAEVPF